MGSLYGFLRDTKPVIYRCRGAGGGVETGTGCGKYGDCSAARLYAFVASLLR